MQDYMKDMKQILFQVLEFQIVQGATFWDTQLAPSKFNPWGASGQLLISNTGQTVEYSTWVIILYEIVFKFHTLIERPGSWGYKTFFKLNSTAHKK